MERLNDGSGSQPGSQENDTVTVDPLMEQMRSTLRLGSPASSFRRRERRFSDADVRPADGTPAIQQSIAIRSRDGSRWLPVPDEMSQRVRHTSSDCNKQDSFGSFPIQPGEAHTCSSAVCAISKVFETTELLELILSSLDTKDIISLRRTNHHWHSTVEHSPQLRLHFFTYGQWSRPGASFQLLPLNLPGLTIEQGDELHLGQWINISFTPEAARKICPEAKPSRRVRSRSIFEGLRGGLGSRTQGASDGWPRSNATPTVSSTLQYEDLFVTQPPIVGMQAFIVYPKRFASDDGRCEGDEAEERDLPAACAKLNSDAGITLGFLAETAHELLASHRKESGPSNLDPADVRVVYKGIMSFCAPEEAPRKRNHSRLVTRI